MDDALNPFVLEKGPKTRTPLEIRRDAAQATLDKFREVPFEPGKVDCVQVLKFHLRKIGRPPKFGVALNYGTLLQGKAALRRIGFASIGDALSSKYPEITPAACLVGDLIELAALEDEATKGLGAIVVYLGNNAVFGFHEATVGGTVMRIGEPGSVPPLRGWRVL